jgi:hypothetical protein
MYCVLGQALSAVLSIPDSFPQSYFLVGIIEIRGSDET